MGDLWIILKFILIEIQISTSLHPSENQDSQKLKIW